MKRISAILIVFIMFFSGCGASRVEMPTDDAYHPETDHPYSMFMQLTTTTFAETDTGWYFHLPTMLFYMDKTAMEPVPVCGKPNCLHYDEPEKDTYCKCNAYFNTSPGFDHMGWYGGSIYIPELTHVYLEEEKRYESHWDIQRVSPDGSRRKTVWRLDENVWPTGMLIHRGVLYVSAETYDEALQAQCGIWALSLQNSRARPELVLKTTASSSMNAVYCLTAYGNCLYFIRFLNEEGARELCIFNMQTRALTTVGAPEAGFEPTWATFQNGKLLLEGCTIPPDAPRQRLYRCELDGSDPVCVLEGLGYCMADTQYLYRAPDMMETQAPCIEIYDADMTLADRVDLRALWPEGRMTITCASARGGQVLVKVQRGGSSGLLEYFCWFPKSEIGTGRITLRPFIENDFKRYSVVGRQ